MPALSLFSLPYHYQVVKGSSSHARIFHHIKSNPNCPGNPVSGDGEFYVTLFAYLEVTCAHSP